MSWWAYDADGHIQMTSENRGDLLEMADLHGWSIEECLGLTQCTDEHFDYFGHLGNEGDGHHCTRNKGHGGDHECVDCEVLWQ